MDNATHIKAQWRLPTLIGLNLLALALLATWVFPQSRQLWDASGEWLFRLLNGSLGHLAPWDWFWALTSTRVFDVLVGGALLTLLIHTGWTFKAHEVRSALFHFIGLLLVLLVVRVIFAKLTALFGWQHASPSVALPGAYHLSEHMPTLERLLEVKDRSRRSFPGDHASVLLLWGLFMACFCRGAKRLASLSLAILCVLPRLVAGGHWLADVAVGGVFIALVSFAWGYCTPLAGRIAAGLEYLSRPLLPLLSRLPLVGRWAILR